MNFEQLDNVNKRMTEREGRVSKGIFFFFFSNIFRNIEIEKKILVRFNFLQIDSFMWNNKIIKMKRDIGGKLKVK